MKFGDIILNTWADVRNPHKIGVYINNLKPGAIKLLHSDGKFSDYHYRKLDKEYLIIGHINIKELLVALCPQNSDIEESVNSSLSAVQQLKSKIAAIIPMVELCRNVHNHDQVNDVSNKLRQLSGI